MLKTRVLTRFVLTCTVLYLCHGLFFSGVTSRAAECIPVFGVQSNAFAGDQGLRQSDDGRSAMELIEEDPSRVGNQLHVYEVPEFRDTKAPAGFKPFYVSHFGRHGSRYHTGSSAYAPIVEALGKMHGLGLLTPEGIGLWEALDTLAKCHLKMDGYLTQVGGREHQGVAERLYEHFPQMFRQKNRKEVCAVSSTVVRCTQSMMNFGTALKGRAPELDITYWASGRTDATVTRPAGGKRSNPDRNTSGEKLDSIIYARMEIGRMCRAFFTDSTAASGCVRNSDLKKFFYNLITAGTIGQCLDEDIPSIYHHFTTEELYNYWVARNASTITAHGFTYENGETLRRCGKMIVTDILAKADEALLPGSHRLADLRFGHDGGVLPLIFLLRLKGYEKTWHVGEEEEHGWFGFREICMCTNLQMIFYRNRSGDVIVKFLHNERETTIQCLEPWSGPYYKWSELRPYLVSLTEIDC